MSEEKEIKMSEHKGRKPFESVLSRAVKNIRSNHKAKNFIAVQEEVNRQIDEQPEQQKGIVYLSHIPPGFCEREMKGYFSQFGDVTHISLARSTKTGKLKGYAHIEFKHAVVAKIVAETMNNYILFNRLLKAQYVEITEKKSRFNAEFWKRYSFTDKNYPGLINRRKNANSVNKCDPKRDGKRLGRRLSSLAKINAALLRKGINYSYEPHPILSGAPSIPGKFVLLNHPDNMQVKKRKRSKCREQQLQQQQQQQQSESNTSVDEHKAVLEVDESDKEIEFMTPPNVIKKMLTVQNRSLTKTVNISHQKSKNKRNLTKHQKDEKPLKKKKNNKDSISKSKLASKLKFKTLELKQKKNARETKKKPILKKGDPQVSQKDN